MKTTRDNMSLGAAQIAEGTAANTWKTTKAVDYVIGGRAFSKAATDSIAFAAHPGTAFVALAASQACAFFVMINAAGTVTLIQSKIVPNTTSPNYVATAFEPPGDLDGFACLGAIIVKTNASGAFTATATDLSAANVAATYVDFAVDYGKPILH